MTSIVAVNVNQNMFSYFINHCPWLPSRDISYLKFPTLKMMNYHIYFHSLVYAWLMKLLKSLFEMSADNKKPISS